MIEITLNDLEKDMDKYFEMASNGDIIKTLSSNGSLVILSENNYREILNNMEDSHI